MYHKNCENEMIAFFWNHWMQIIVIYVVTGHAIVAYLCRDTIDDRMMSSERSSYGRLRLFVALMGVFYGLAMLWPIIVVRNAIAAVARCRGLKYKPRKKKKNSNSFQEPL